MRQNRLTPPFVKFELHAYGEVYDFSNSIDNWKDLEFTIKRDKTSGLFHQISFPFEFVLDAYDVIKSIFDKYQYRAKGDMYIYLLKDNWPYVEEQYHDPQIFNLDWTQYNKSDNKIEMDSRRSNLYDHVKAKNRIVYDIPVNGIKEDKQWNFGRIELENNIIFRIVAENTRWSSGGIIHRTPGISYEKAEVSVPDIVYEKTIPEWQNFDENKDTWFAEMNVRSEGSPVKAVISLNSIITSEGSDPHNNNLPNGIPNGALKNARIILIKSSYNKESDETEYIWIVWKDLDVNRELTEWNEEINFDLKPGEKLYLIIECQLDGGGWIVYNIDGTIQLYYNGKHKEEAIDVIDPKVMLQSLVNKMTESEGVYQSDIEDFNTDRNNLIMMSAAESIRGIPATDTSEPQVHTSYRNFVEWMNAYGYEQHITDNKLTFRKRGAGFRGDLTAIELEEHECADLREYVNEGYLYSGLKIGYNRKDIENTNGRFEFNGVHDYSTDLSMGEHMLELISPYRADCYGIEFLTQERGKDSTDDKSDKDLFLVNVSESSAYYTTVKNKYSGNYLNDTIFNGNLNPYNLMKLNEDLLGVSVNKLSFAASDSNSNIIIDDQRIDADYDIPEGTGLFDPIIYDIASKNIQHLPSGENMNGIIRFRYKGQTYEGFIEQVSKNPAWEMETVWILYKRKN